MTDPHTYSLSLTEQELKVLASLLEIHMNQIGHLEDPRIQQIASTMKEIRDKIGIVRTAIAIAKKMIHAHSHTR